MTRPKVVIFQVPAFTPGRVLGGAEVVAAQLAHGLQGSFQLTVVCGHPAGSTRPSPSSDHGFEVISGFPIDEAARCLGHVRPRLTPAARCALAEADAVISVERSLALPLRGVRIVTLGGVGYLHTLDLIAQGLWQRLVVPSPLAARQVSERAAGKGRVVVVPNGIDVDLFRTDDAPAAPPRTLRLLLAARPVPDKGLPAALRLARVLCQRGLPVVLTCFDQPDGLDGSGLLPTLGPRDDDVLEVLPWCDHADMPRLYASAALTLCLSTAEEGFGLAAAESLACGTPVLATPAGFLPSLVPPEHGLHLVDPHAPPEAWADQALAALRTGAETVRQGRRFVQHHYGLRTMVDRFAATIAEALAEHTHPSGTHIVGTWQVQRPGADDRRQPAQGTTGVPAARSACSP